MSAFDDIEISEDIQESGDRVAMAPLETDVHDVTITTAYLDETKNGAKSFTLKLRIDESGRQVTITNYYTSGKAKGQSIFYTDSRGTKRFLPGFTVLQDLALLVADCKVKGLETELRAVPIYDFEAGKEVSQKREVIMSFIGKQASLGLLRIMEDNYSDPTKSRVITEINKVFQYETHLTSVEKDAGATEGVFIESWKQANSDPIIDRREKSKNATEDGAKSEDTDNAETPDDDEDVWAS